MQPSSNRWVRSAEVLTGPSPDVNWGLRALLLFVLQRSSIGSASREPPDLAPLAARGSCPYTGVPMLERRVEALTDDSAGVTEPLGCLGGLAAARKEDLGADAVASSISVP